MIIGLTHTEEGKLIQQFAVDVKVSIGLPVGGDRRHPQKLDHFYFTTKSKSGEWVEDKKLTDELQKVYCPELVDSSNNKYRPPIREFDILFLSDDIEEIFRTEYAWWSKSECKCRGNGNGTTASRAASIVPPEILAKYDKGTRYVPWLPCGKGCPDLERGDCGASGVMHFTLFDRPTFGSVAVYYTTSIRTIRQIYSSLDQIKTFTRGFLKGIRFTLKLKPGKTRYMDDKGKPATGSAFFVHIEFRYKDYEQMIQQLLGQSTRTVKAQAYQQHEIKLLSQDLTPIPTPTIIPLNEQDEARIITGEFAPPGDREPEPEPEPEPEDLAPPETDQMPEDAAELVAVDKMEQEFEEICERLKLTKGKKDAILGRLGGSITDAREFMVKFFGYVKTLNIELAGAEDYLKRGLGNVNWLWETLESLVKLQDEAKTARANKVAAAEAEAKAAPPAKKGRVAPAAAKTTEKAGEPTKAVEEKAPEAKPNGGGKAQTKGKDDWGEW